jgi:hypothetical protein
MLDVAAFTLPMLLSGVPIAEEQPAHMLSAQRPASAFFIVFIVFVLSVLYVYVRIPNSLSVPVFRLYFNILNVQCQGVSGVMTL